MALKDDRGRQLARITAVAAASGMRIRIFLNRWSHLHKNNVRISERKEKPKCALSGHGIPIHPLNLIGDNEIEPGKKISEMFNFFY